MGDRYYITGVQVSLIKTASERGDTDLVGKTLDGIVEKQYIGTTDETGKMLDVNKSSKLLSNGNKPMLNGDGGG